MFSRISQLSFNKNKIWNKRNLWQWVDDTFNRYDEERTKEIGPNLACAEWLMKNGAQVRNKGCKEFVSHYDCLPIGQGGAIKQFKIEQIYAGKEASISHIGFYYFTSTSFYGGGDCEFNLFLESGTVCWGLGYLNGVSAWKAKLAIIRLSTAVLTTQPAKGCENISDISFVGCHTINNEALNKLQILKNCLASLKISSCVNISDEGITELEHLQALKHLELKDIQFTNELKMINHLKSKLPQCNIVFSE